MGGSYKDTLYKNLGLIPIKHHWVICMYPSCHPEELINEESFLGTLIQTNRELKITARWIKKSSSTITGSFRANNSY